MSSELDLLVGDMVEVVDTMAGPAWLWTEPGAMSAGGERGLQLRVGDVVLILGKGTQPTTGWWYVTCRGSLGWIYAARLGEVVGRGSCQRTPSAL